METPPISHAHSPRRSSLRRTLTQAIVFSLIPLGTAFAQASQSMPHVRVVRDGSEIRAMRTVAEVRMTPPKGTILEVIYIDGNRYTHRDSNWYWVLLPPDPWATRPSGWIRGDAIELIAPEPPQATPLASHATAPVATAPRIETRSEGPLVTAVELAPVEEIPAARQVLPDVILNFQFGRSELTEEAKDKLASALTIAKPHSRMSLALEGYADWVGTDAYNDQLGLARAEAVRRYLADQLRIPAGSITVVSYGEANPAAPNTTRKGRAQNRRVVIRVGA
jgi:outer membrane protein OmpA-like peptidoglycan-associated protein